MLWLEYAAVQILEIDHALTDLIRFSTERH